jgi:hypothetical protein
VDAGQRMQVFPHTEDVAPTTRRRSSWPSRITLLSLTLWLTEPELEGALLSRARSLGSGPFRIMGTRPGFAVSPSARHPEGRFQGAWLAWLPTTLCLQTPLFARAIPRLAGGLVRAGIKEIEEVSHG